METESNWIEDRRDLQDLLASASRAQVLARLKARFQRLPAEVSLSAELLRERWLEAEKEG